MVLDSLHHPISFHPPLSPSILLSLPPSFPFFSPSASWESDWFDFHVRCNYIRRQSEGQLIQLGWRGAEAWPRSVRPISRPITAAAAAGEEGRRPLILPHLTRLLWPFSRLMAFRLPLPTAGDLCSAKVRCLCIRRRMSLIFGGVSYRRILV